jgi:hypothetical protein
MSSAAVVSGIFTELEEIVDVVMPGLEVSASGSPTLATLVNSDELVVVQL